MDGFILMFSFLRTVLDQCPCVAPFLVFTPHLVLALLCLWGSDFFWEVLLFGTACGFVLPF